MYTEGRRPRPAISNYPSLAPADLPFDCEFPYCITPLNGRHCLGVRSIDTISQRLSALYTKHGLTSSILFLFVKKNYGGLPLSGNWCYARNFAASRLCNTAWGSAKSYQVDQCVCANPVFVCDSSTVNHNQRDSACMWRQLQENDDGHDDCGISKNDRIHIRERHGGWGTQKLNVHWRHFVSSLGGHKQVSWRGYCSTA